MAGDPRRRHQRGEAIEQLQRGQDLRAGPARSLLGGLVDQVLAVELAQPVQGERWPGTVTQQPLAADSVSSRDAHRAMRQLVHFNVTARPTAAWTLQQLRKAIDWEQKHRYLLNDRDRIFARHLDQSIESLGLKFLRSPPGNPMVNAVYERLTGTIRRECLDWLIPMSESHLRSVLKFWGAITTVRVLTWRSDRVYPIHH